MGPGSRLFPSGSGPRSMCGLPVRRPPAGLRRPAPSGGEVGVNQAVDQDLAFGDGLDP
jgi:hypothetical protein